MDENCSELDNTSALFELALAPLLPSLLSVKFSSTFECSFSIQNALALVKLSAHLLSRKTQSN
jgi:hypothetical protein